MLQQGVQMLRDELDAELVLLGFVLACKAVGLRWCLWSKQLVKWYCVADFEQILFENVYDQWAADRDGGLDAADRQVVLEGLLI